MTRHGFIILHAFRSFSLFYVLSYTDNSCLLCCYSQNAISKKTMEKVSFHGFYAGTLMGSGNVVVHFDRGCLCEFSNML